jgi:hypothetical protein
MKREKSSAVTRERLATAVSGNTAAGAPMLQTSPKALRFAEVKDAAGCSTKFGSHAAHRP